MECAKRQPETDATIKRLWASGDPCLLILRSQDCLIQTESGLFRSHGLREIPLVALLVLSASTLRSYSYHHPTIA